MSVPVRALLVDGSASNAGLLSEELARGGFEPVLRRVETRADFESALSAESWDVVLADLAAPGLSAFEALDSPEEAGSRRSLRRRGGSAGRSRTAVRAMKEGAQNCIAHQNLSRLAPILERELREAAIRRERRIAQQALSESELRLRGLAESAPDAILIADASGTLLFANRAAGLLFGHPRGIPDRPADRDPPARRSASRAGGRASDDAPRSVDRPPRRGHAAPARDRSRRALPRREAAHDRLRETACRGANVPTSCPFACPRRSSAARP